jgi:hypothetical protein
MKWRVGRHLGRTIYLQVDHEPSDADIFLGIMETVELAERVVDCINSNGHVTLS